MGIAEKFAVAELFLSTFPRGSKEIRLGRYRSESQYTVMHIGASLLVTLDKAEFAKLNKRKEAYKAIPYYTGSFALFNIQRFLLSKEGPIARSFYTESSPRGVPWEELSETQIMARGGEEHPILRDTEVFFKEVLSDRMAGIITTGKFARLVISPDFYAESGFNAGNILEKFYVHQLGSENGFGKDIPIPARPFFPVSASDLTSEEHRKLHKLVKKGIEEGREEMRAVRMARRRRSM